MIHPFDIFAVFTREKGTRYFLALEQGYPGKRIKSLAVELGPNESIPSQGTLFTEEDWDKARIPPHPVLVKNGVLEIKTEYETKPLGRLSAVVKDRLPGSHTVLNAHAFA